MADETKDKVWIVTEVVSGAASVLLVTRDKDKAISTWRDRLFRNTREVDQEDVDYGTAVTPYELRTDDDYIYNPATGTYFALSSEKYRCTVTEKDIE